MQAIARVNRTFPGKPGGLIVGHIGVFSNLQKALVEYSPRDRDQVGVPIDEIVAAMLEKRDIIRGTTIDWNLKESVRAVMRTTVRCLLAKYDYPPGLEKAIELILEQAEVFASGAADEDAN